MSKKIEEECCNRNCYTHNTKIYAQLWNFQTTKHLFNFSNIQSMYTENKKRTFSDIIHPDVVFTYSRANSSKGCDAHEYVDEGAERVGVESSSYRRKRIKKKYWRKAETKSYRFRYHVLFS